MLVHHLLAFYRSTTRHRLYAALSVLTLALGMSVVVVVGLLLRFETSFDRWVPNADAVFRLSVTYGGTHNSVLANRSFGVVPPPALAALEADSHAVVAGVQMMDVWEAVSSSRHHENQRVFYAGPNLFDVLALPLVAGDPHSALNRPDGVIIREDLARTYFGTTDVIGRELRIREDLGPVFYQMTYHISAVLKTPPPNSDLDLPIIAPLNAKQISAAPRGWGRVMFHTFLRFRTAADGWAAARALPETVRRHVYGSGSDLHGMTVRLALDPLPALHFADADRESTIAPGADGRIFYGLGAVALVALVIAVLNFINLTTARSAARTRETALRKVLGATSGALILQFLFESTGYAALAGLISLAMVELALPAIDAIGDWPLTLSYGGGDEVLACLAMLILLIGLAGGLYPALRHARLDPLAALASARHPGGGQAEARVRAFLIGVQFAIAVVSIICTFVIGAQAHFLRTDDRGFRRDGLLLMYEVNRPEANQRRVSILAAFRHTPGVVSVTTSMATPGLPPMLIAPFRRAGSPAPDLWMDVDVVGADYLKTYGARLLAGRMLDGVHPNDDLGNGHDLGDLNLVINERSARALGFASPQAAIGAHLSMTQPDPIRPSQSQYRPHQIVGVIQDMDLGSGRLATPPESYFYSSREQGAATIRYAGASEREISARLQSAWTRTAADMNFYDKPVETALSPFFKPEEQTAKLFAIGSGLAVTISVLGLFGLASFNIERRFKEMCLRKTLGASGADILRLLLLEMLWPVVIGALVAWPLAYFALHGWLAGFAQRISLSPAYFLAATGLCGLIAVLTVLAQSIRLSWSQPAEALRHE